MTSTSEKLLQVVDYKLFPRRRLQQLCKKHGIPANKTNLFMAEALSGLAVLQVRRRNKGSPRAENESILYVCLSVCLCIFIFIFGFLSWSENLEARSLCQCVLVMRKDRNLMGHERVVSRRDSSAEICLFVSVFFLLFARGIGYGVLGMFACTKFASLYFFLHHVDRLSLEKLYVFTFGYAELLVHVLR
jgi:hypothetical protein